jgi:NhaP-type Na+/H+ or K+/H+ antiporter
MLMRDRGSLRIVGAVLAWLCSQADVVDSSSPLGASREAGAMAAAVCVFSFLVILYVSQSARLGRAYLNGPIIFLVAGGVIGLTLVDAATESEVIRTVAEVTLVLVLFHDAAELQPRQLRTESAFTGRLLLIGLPLTIGVGFLLTRGLFPQIGVWLALLIAAALAPTDAGLGAATVLNPVIPGRVRRILNVESGLNDGLATPVVLFAVAAAAGLADDDVGHGVIEAVLELVIGAVVGALIGFGAGRLIEWSRGRGWADKGLVPIATLAVPLLCYYGAVGLGGNGFIAAFVAGTAAAASQAIVEDVHASMALTGLTSTFLSYAVWMLFGVTAVAHLALLLSWQNLVFAVLSLTVVRMAPVALSLLGSGLKTQTVVFVGWFGPRGLASIIFALIAVESLHDEPAVATVLSVIATTVVLSVVVHGLTAPPWAARYGTWVNRTHPTVETTKSVEPVRRHGFPEVRPSGFKEEGVR